MVFPPTANFKGPQREKKMLAEVIAAHLLELIISQLYSGYFAQTPPLIKKTLTPTQSEDIDLALLAGYK